MKKRGIGEKPHFEKTKTLGLVRVRPGYGSTGFGQVIALTGLLTNQDWSSHRVARRASPGLITMVYNAYILGH